MHDQVPWERLYAAAEQARQRAHATYSNFKVGAAVWCDDGSIVQGCNVENASYGLTVCAERNAISAMVLAGRRVAAVAIVVDAERVVSPCGMCRQVLVEFGAPGLPVGSKTMKGLEKRWSLGELLPDAFTKSYL